MDTSHLVVGRLGPNLRPRQQIQNRRPGAPRSQARRGARDVSRTDGPDRAEQSDEFIGLLAHEVAQTRKASRFWTFSIVKGTQRLVFRTVSAVPVTLSRALLYNWCSLLNLIPRSAHTSRHNLTPSR